MSCDTLKKKIVDLNSKLGEKTARIEELGLERNSLRIIRLLSLQSEAGSEAVPVEQTSSAANKTVESSNPEPKPTKGSQRPGRHRETVRELKNRAKRSQQTLTLR